jgi:hypothetical protein
MTKRSTMVGLDVHKESIEVVTAKEDAPPGASSHYFQGRIRFPPYCLRRFARYLPTRRVQSAQRLRGRYKWGCDQSTDGLSHR